MRRIANAITFLIALHGVRNATAQTLYECAGQGTHTYQQTPCPATTHQVRTLETIPEPAPTPAQRAERSRQLAQDRDESAFLSHLAGTDWTPVRSSSRYARSSSRPTGVTGNQAECSMAKANRTRVLRAVGLDRTMELLSRLDAEVAAACAH